MQFVKLQSVMQVVSIFCRVALTQIVFLGCNDISGKDITIDDYCPSACHQTVAYLRVRANLIDRVQSACYAVNPSIQRRPGAIR